MRDSDLILSQIRQRLEILYQMVYELETEGGTSFEPTETQLAAMNSGITSTDVQQIDTNKTNISNTQTLTQGIDSTGDNFIEINSVKLYFGSTTPSNPSDGDWWLD